VYDELELWILATWKHLEVVISTCCELHDELAYYTILDNLLNLDVLIFYIELEELEIHMKHQVLEVLLPFILFLHEFN